MALGVGLACGLGGVGLRHAQVRFACALALAAAAGAASLAARLEAVRYERPARPFEAVLEGRVTRVAATPERVSIDLEDVADPLDGARLPRRVRLSERIEHGRAGLAAALPGDRLRLQARMRAPRGRTNPGGGDPARRLARRGIAAVGGPAHPQLVLRREIASAEALRALHGLRRRGGERLARAGAGGALLRALGLGDRSGLEEPARAAFRRLGVSHLLAVSGLHLALAAGLAFALARRALLRVPGLALRIDPRRAALGLAVLAACGYAALSGWDVPVRRALVLLVVLAAGLAARRPVHAPSALAAAAVVVLARQPEALFEPGAQLSFAASGALLAAAARSGASGPRRRGRLANAVAQGLGASAVALAATAPWVAMHFGAVSPWSPASNLVLIPWTGFVLLPAALVLVTGACLGAPDFLLAAPLAWGAALGEVTLGAVQAVAARAPLAPAPPPAAATLALGFVLAGLAVRVRTPGCRLVVALASAGLFGLAPPAAIEPAPPRVVFLDVGQGDATVLQGQRATVLVDAGTALPGGVDRGRHVVVPALRALGVRRLDLLVASHADLDHRGGAVAVLRELPVRQVWIPRGSGASPAWEALRKAARARRVAVVERGVGDRTLHVGDLAVTPLWPAPRAGRSDSENDRSLVVRVELGGRRVLLAGDLEAAGEEALREAAEPALRADLLKLSHHGSRTSSRPRFLAAVGGRLAVASAPHEGRFAMPHPEVRRRVRDAGYALWWTGRDGAVLVGLGFDRGLRVRGFRVAEAVLLSAPGRRARRSPRPCAAPRTRGSAPPRSRAGRARDPNPH